MFIQVIEAPCTRRDEVHALLEQWQDRLATGAEGWLGATYGFTDDDQFFAVVRFASRDDAMRNSARPEQGRFAEEMTALMDGPPRFHDCDDVMTFLDADADDAGFVQVIQGRVADRGAVTAMLADVDELHRMRPEIIGGTFAFEPDGTFTETIAFTSEEEARKGERIEPPAEVRAQVEEVLRGATFHDLHEPWFTSA